MYTSHYYWQSHHSDHPRQNPVYWQQQPYQLALALESFDLTFSLFPPFCALAWASPTGLSLLDSCLDDVLLLLFVVELELVALDDPEPRLRRCWTSWKLRLFLISARRFQPNSVLIHLSPGERQSLPTNGMAAGEFWVSTALGPRFSLYSASASGLRLVNRPLVANRTRTHIYTVGYGAAYRSDSLKVNKRHHCKVMSKFGNMYLIIAPNCVHVDIR